MLVPVLLPVFLPVFVPVFVPVLLAALGAGVDVNIHTPLCVNIDEVLVVVVDRGKVDVDHVLLVNAGHHVLELAILLLHGVLVGFVVTMSRHWSFSRLSTFSIS